MPKMTKKLPNNLHGWAFYKITKFVLTKKGHLWRTAISLTKVWLNPQIDKDPKVNPQIDKDLKP